MKFHERQLSTRGGPKTKLVSFQDAIELVMVLPGHKAKETRTQFSDIIKRYMAGDQTLITEIKANASSTSPIAQLAQASIDGVCTVKRRRMARDVRWAFDCQEEALELRHQRDLRLIEAEDDEDMIAMEMENEILRRENDEAVQYMKTLEMEIDVIKQEQTDVLLQKKELMNGIRILSGPFI